MGVSQLTAEILLNQLHKVRKNGTGSWMACCPAHDDKSPSLSVKECADGHILIHCFAGCEPYEILSSVGLDMGDLFPDRDAHSFDDRAPTKQPDLRGRDVEIAKLEFRIKVYADMIRGGTILPKEDAAAMRSWCARLKQLKASAA